MVGRSSWLDMETTPAWLLAGVCSVVSSAAAAYLTHKFMTPSEEHPPTSAPAAAPPAAASSSIEARRPASTTPVKQRRPETALQASDTVIAVTYQLPIVITRAASGGFLVEWETDSHTITRGGLRMPTNVIWVGCISIALSEDEQEAVEKLLWEKHNCVAVFLEPTLKQAFYNGFCRGYLRPIMHNQLAVPDDADPFKEDEWRAYCQVNRIFAQKVMEVYEPGYMTWVHDYHLLLLPSCILRKHRTAHIGLFLHSPFPASDVFRTIAVRDELLRAMLNADLLGFFMFEYTRNFLTCCKRMLGLEYEFQRGGFLGIEYGGRHVMLQVSTFGVSPDLLKAHMALPDPASELSAVRKARDAVATKHGKAPVVLVGVDYLDRLKGLQLKLLAWEALLTDYPKYRTGHVLVQLCVTTRNREFLQPAGGNANAISAGLEKIVARINTKWPGSTHMEVRDGLSAAARLQLWQIGHVAVHTAVREAVNTMPHEYVFARHEANLPPGVIVLSEFTGFARVFNGALRANPFSQKELVEALDKALEMAPVERAARAARDLQYVVTNTMEEWGRRFVVDLRSVERKAEEDFVSVGFGLASFRMVGMGSEFKSLDQQQTIEAYSTSTRRAILLDWGGTLTPADSLGFNDTRDADSYAVPESVLEVLRLLCADPANHVMILSGLRHDRVEGAFASVPNLSLAAEHGFHYRVKGGAWQQLKPGVDTSWREVAASVMNVYALRTNGAYMQTKGSSIVWYHQLADPEFGTMQARELQFTLQGVLSAFPVIVRTGKGYVEACQKDVDKGAMAARFVELCSAPDALQFVLCMGDDSSDELMFAALHSKYGKPANAPPGAQGRHQPPPPAAEGNKPKVFAVTVGRKPSEASSYLQDHSEVVDLLEKLTSLGADAGKPSRGSAAAALDGGLQALGGGMYASSSGSNGGGMMRGMRRISS